MRIDRLHSTCPACRAVRRPLDERLGIEGFVGPQARRLLGLAGASWSFDRSAALLREFCGLRVCDNTIREVCRGLGGKIREWQREDPAASAPFRAAEGDVEFQTDGTSVNTRDGWREMRLSVFAKRKRGNATTGRADWEQRKLPGPHVRVVLAGVRSSDRLGPTWRRTAARLGVEDAAEITVLADGAKWIWAQAEANLPGAAGVLDVYHAMEHLWAAAKARFGEGTAAAEEWVAAHRGLLLSGGADALLAAPGLDAPEWAGLRTYFEPHRTRTGYAARLAEGRSIGSGLVEGACKHVVGLRLKQTGARWRVRRVERMASLCAVLASDQWTLYWASAA